MNIGMPHVGNRPPELRNSCRIPSIAPSSRVSDSRTLHLFESASHDVNGSEASTCATVSALRCIERTQETHWFNALTRDETSRVNWERCEGGKP